MAPPFGSRARFASDPGGTTDSRSVLSSSPSSTSSGMNSVARVLSNFHFGSGRSKSLSTSNETKWGPYGLTLLYKSEDPLVDIIFVHGLRGGSVKTWCKGDERFNFWPEQWLPLEPEFQNIRIHSFGYDADFKDSKKTNLDLHEFARSLFADMASSPDLRNEKDTPIILVGHSMGGLVIKKAYLLAQQDDREHVLASRIQAMFFLASPHRGADCAKLLSNLLKTTMNPPRQYINDLMKGSPQLRIIDDEFRWHREKLQFWTFYESLETKIGTSTMFLVDRESATLGCKNEVVRSLHADHSNICKYIGIDDPNYKVVRNALAKAIEELSRERLMKKYKEDKALLSTLEAYLHINHFSEDDLSNFMELKADNSCQWILNVPSYQQWFSKAGRDREVFWLSGQPGSGKTMIAAHLATHLQTTGFDACYYFFKEGHKDQQTISGLLRQIAYQMSDKHMEVRRRLAQMQDNSITFDKDDERAIWRKVFVNEVLKAPLVNQQIWIIDGLDECRDSEKLFPMLSKIDSAFPLSIFISSRRVQPLEKHFTALKSRLFNHHIVPRDTLVDIRTYIEAACDEMDLEGHRRNEVLQIMTQKSEGSFLWTKLAFEQLDQTFAFNEDGEEGMMEALKEIPSEMLDLYEQVLQTMCRNRDLPLTKGILAWVVCANRKMKILELQAALQLDLGKSIPNIERSVDVLCGQLIRVEKTGSVQLIHTTARDFLLRSDLDSELAVRRYETHERLAIVCLNYLCSNQMQPPRSRNLMSELKDINSDFADYAITAWSDHVAGASSRNGRLMSLVCKFLRTNVLTWFEYIARRKKNLHHITRTARNLRNYLDRRIKHAAPLGSEFSFIDQWTIDMLRVAAKFGRSLLLYPSTIHFIIPPLCPFKSSIYQQFGSSDGLLTISGFADEVWDDCISYIEHRDTRAMSLAGADNMFAIGLKSGYVKLYHKTICQDRVSFFHGEPVKLLKFDNASQRLATSGNRKFKLWTIDGELIWEKTHTDPPVTLVFSQEDDILVAGTKASGVASWRCADGENTPIHPEDSDNQNGVRKFAARQAILSSSISPDLKTMVIAYRGRCPEIWSLEKGIRLGRFEKDALSIFQVMFNPNPNIELLVFSYQDGEMSLFNPWTQKELTSVQGEGYTLAATPDGRTLATGDMLGTIKIWDFETLHLLYVIKSPDYEIRQLAFSGDGLRLFDIRDSKSKVWEPAALVRKSVNDDSSVSDSAHGNEMAPTVGSYGITVAITVMLAPPDVDCIFVGKDDGSVCCYDKRTGKHISKLYSHRLDVLPTVIRWNSTKSLLATLDASSTIQIWRLEKASYAQGSGWKAVEKVFLVKRESPVRDIHFTPDGTHILIRGTIADSICPIFESTPEQNFPTLPFPDDSDRLASHWMWYKVGIDEQRLLLATRNGRVWLYRQESPQVHEILENPVQLVNHKGQEDLPLIKRMTLDYSAAFLVIEFEEDSTKGPSSPKILAYSMGDVINSGKLEVDIPANPILYLAVADVKSWLGFYGSQAVFLDTTLWVRSLNIRKHASSGCIGGIGDAYLYFFIPYELIGGNNGVDGTVTEQGNVVFPREGELGVVCNALSYSFDV